MLRNGAFVGSAIMGRVRRGRDGSEGCGVWIEPFAQLRPIARHAHNTDKCMRAFPVGVCTRSGRRVGFLRERKRIGNAFCLRDAGNRSSVSSEVLAGAHAAGSGAIALR